MRLRHMFAAAGLAGAIAIGGMGVAFADVGGIPPNPKAGWVCGAAGANAQRRIDQMQATLGRQIAQLSANPRAARAVAALQRQLDAWTAAEARLVALQASLCTTTTTTTTTTVAPTTA